MNSLLRLNTKLETDADANAALRSTFREDRKAKKRRLNDAARDGLGRGIEMLEETDADASTAKMLMQMTCAHQSERDNFKSLRASGIFGSETLTGMNHVEVKRHGTGQFSHVKRCEAKKIERKPYRIRKKETAAAVNNNAANNNAPSASALAALSMYGSDSDSTDD